MSKSLQRLGYQAVQWDIRHGEGYDLLKPGPRRNLMSLVARAHHVHFAPPCSSFSIARGAGAPRSRQYPLGKPDLNLLDQQRVLQGNALLRFTCRLFARCIAAGTSACLENPRSSRMFLCAPLNRMGGQKVHTVFCGYGAPWRKQTTLQVWSCPLLAELARSCSSAGALCDFIRKPHRVLNGNAPGGLAWTKVAEPYPRGFCRAFARLVHKSHTLCYQKSLLALCNSPARTVEQTEVLPV